MIGNRMLFGGRLLRSLLCSASSGQPQALRVVGETTGSDNIMEIQYFLGHILVDRSNAELEVKVIDNFMTMKYSHVI